jgi:hypothetical protein
LPIFTKVEYDRGKLSHTAFSTEKIFLAIALEEMA